MTQKRLMAGIDRVATIGRRPVWVEGAVLRNVDTNDCTFIMDASFRFLEL